MKKTTLALGLCLALATTAGAQKQGGISASMLQQIEKSQGSTATNKALFNAVASNRIDNLAKNFSNRNTFDTHFSVETTKQSIHDQKSSGRCWMFSSFNVFRADFARHHADSLSVEFSHDYLFFYDQLEKANLMLQGVIDNAKKPMDDVRVQFFFKNPLNDGGTFCGAADLAPKYGLVPKSVQPETFSAENTSKISSLISSKLREYGLELRKMVADGKKAQAIDARKTEMLSTVYRMLAMALGEPVKEFTYQFRNRCGEPVGEPRRYTPLEFYNETVGHKLAGTFIMVMNDPRRPYHKTYEVEYDRHVYDGTNWKYLNLPMEDIAKLAIASLKDGKKMYSSYDVGKQFDRELGYLDTENFDYASLFSTTFPMNKADRIATFDSGSTHAMTLVAVDLDKDGNPLKWKVENSWGPNNGAQGCLIMSNRWFNEYMFRLVVDKKYVPENLQKEFEQKPVMVMPEDPLFGEDD
ncbi:C1 family peptidase [Leyella stercorea]|jgi:bleomycin hydrolase|uniref:Aminopeptidase n=1 Tax=Leyella stercorea DSM 18206 TaxID=1002367 RepID=G6B0I0_9BACT|nr:C1 family peptidase [Leyella stercorea]EHJ37357.1 putative aminopeptidase E [Leyella stercorea DSM 18206]